MNRQCCYREKRKY